MTADDAIEERDTLDTRDQLHAFVLDGGTEMAIKQAAKDMGINKPTIKKGNIKSATAALARSRSPKILLVDIEDSKLPLSDVDSLAEACEPGVFVVAIGNRNDVGLFRNLINNGVGDYIVKPVTTTILQKSLSLMVDDGKKSRTTSRLGKLILVVGARGGSGATTVATSLAWLLAEKKERRVCLVDLDLTFGTTALSLDVEPSRGLLEALADPERLDNLYIERALVHYTDMLHLLAAEGDLSDRSVVDDKALDFLIKETRSRYHYVVVDLPRGGIVDGDKIFREATTCILVTAPAIAGVRDFNRIAARIASLNERAQLLSVLNKHREKNGVTLELDAVEKGIERRLDVVIPYEPSTVGKNAEFGRPAAQGKGSAPHALNRLAEIVSGAGLEKRDASLMNLFQGWF